METLAKIYPEIPGEFHVLLIGFVGFVAFALPKTLVFELLHRFLDGALVVIVVFAKFLSYRTDLL